MIETMNFDVFLFKKECNNEELVIICTYLMDKHNLFKDLKIDPDRFQSYAKTIQAGYNDVVYHNATHGIDVC